mmetsp:Transcript_4644/g.19882  ORF Transcript_4644/g.19882 Transcript_4644/m.19882 type:complete len:83 (-) Transcript_4644:1533-1781(-)
MLVSFLLEGTGNRFQTVPRHLLMEKYRRMLMPKSTRKEERKIELIIQANPSGVHFSESPSIAFQQLRPFQRPTGRNLQRQLR